MNNSDYGFVLNISTLCCKFCNLVTFVIILTLVFGTELLQKVLLDKHRLIIDLNIKLYDLKKTRIFISASDFELANF